jgi:hypothetical protein
MNTETEKEIETETRCTAYTKNRTRCKKHTSGNDKRKVCQYHQTYYDDWFATHPPPNGWRLDLDEKEEYKFQIENGHVQITEDYVRSLNDPAQSDYYEYLLHLPHIDLNVNTRMIIYLFRSYLSQFSSINLTLENLYTFFGNMFRNPTFCPGAFALRIVYVLDEIPNRPSFMAPLSESRFREVFNCLLGCPYFKGLFYMNWKDQMVEKLPKSQHLPIFLEMLQEKTIQWQSRMKNFNKELKHEVVEFALTPERLMDWYLDWEKLRDIKAAFPRR